MVGSLAIKSLQNINFSFCGILFEIFPLCKIFFYMQAGEDDAKMSLLIVTLVIMKVLTIMVMIVAMMHEITLKVIDIDNIGCLEPFLPL